MFLADVTSPTTCPGPYTGLSVVVVRARSAGWQSADGVVLSEVVGGVAATAVGIVVVSGARDVGGASTVSSLVVVLDGADRWADTWRDLSRVNTSRVATTSTATIPVPITATQSLRRGDTGGLLSLRPRRAGWPARARSRSSPRRAA